MDIEEGFSPIDRASTMSIACENRAAFRAAKRSSGNRPQNALVETGLFPLERFTATEFTAVIFTGNGHRGRL
jgi:hypothetical protein